MVASFFEMTALLFGLWIAAGMPAASQSRPVREIPNLAGKILTVKGPIAPSELGQTLMHEHLFVDFKLALPERPDPATDVELSRQPLTLANLQAARSGHWNADNDFLGSFADSLEEVLDYKTAGGGAVVDVSNIRLGRDPVALLKISHASGLHVVMGAGWYQKRYHPLNMSELKLEDMTEIIVRDIVAGADGTDIRAGVVGEVGVNGNPLTENELKSIRASARASRLTGAPISFHVGGVGEEKFRVLDMLGAEGVAMSSVVMGHSNSMAADLPFARRILARGVYIEFDWLGAPGSPGGYLESRHDRKVAQGIAQLAKEGYAGRIVLSHDICTKLQLKKYGGLGYTYIHEYFLPVLHEMGVSEADIHKMMVENPARVLAFVEPRPLVGEGGAGR
jgi:phosphotriesterase-related protein